MEYLLTNWIAITSLIISGLTIAYTIIKNQIKLELDSTSPPEWGIAILYDDGKSSTNDFGFLKTNIRIINSSNIDISFFDLAVIDPQSHEVFHYYNQKQSHVFNELQNSKAIIMIDKDNKFQELNLPSGDSGIVKAHSLTSIDLLISPENEIEELFVIFKVAQKKSLLNKNKLGYINSTYQSFSLLIHVDKLSKPNFEEIYSSLHIE